MLVYNFILGWVEWWIRCQVGKDRYNLKITKYEREKYLLSYQNHWNKSFALWEAERILHYDNLTYTLNKDVLLDQEHDYFINLKLVIIKNRPDASRSRTQRVFRVYISELQVKVEVSLIKVFNIKWTLILIIIKI